MVVHRHPTRSQLDAILGVPHRPSKSLLVEDRAARHFTRAWLRRAEPELLDEYDVVDVGGTSRLDPVLALPPLKSFRLVVVFDGDQRNRKQLTDERWLAAFLPGNSAPACTQRSYDQLTGALAAVWLSTDEGRAASASASAELKNVISYDAAE